MTTLSFSLIDGRNGAVIYMVLIAPDLEMPLCRYLCRYNANNKCMLYIAFYFNSTRSREH